MPRPTPKTILFTTTLLTSLTPTHAQDFAYNTFSANFGYETQAGSTVSGQSSQPGYNDTANRFTSLLSGHITDIWVPVSRNNAAPNIFDVILRADANGAPGAAIHTWTLTDRAFPFDGQYHDPVRIAVTDPVFLQQGTPYWLDLHATNPDGWFVWHFTRPPRFEVVAQRFAPNGAWNILNPGFTSAYAIAIPAPAALPLLACGALAAPRRRGATR